MNEDVMALFTKEPGAFSEPPGKVAASHGNGTEDGPIEGLTPHSIQVLAKALRLLAEFARELEDAGPETALEFLEKVRTRVARGPHKSTRISSKLSLKEVELKATSALGPVGPIATVTGPSDDGPVERGDFLRDADVMAEFADGPEVFDASPLPSPAAEGGTHTDKGPKFRLTPPPGPTSGPAPTRKSVNGPTPPGWAFPMMYGLCFGADDAQKQRAINNKQAGRVASALQTLMGAGADLARIPEFKAWWWTWATYSPSPERVVEWWWRAMSDLEPKPVAEIMGRTRYTVVVPDEGVDDSSVRRSIYG